MNVRAALDANADLSLLEEPKRLWADLVEGRLRILEEDAREGEAKRYLLVDVPDHARAAGVLTSAEIDVLLPLARGTPSKLVAYGLGLSPSTVSVRLASAASKTGASSRTDLIRVAAMLHRDGGACCCESALTDAEKKILELVRRGLSNDAIAKVRARSVRTVANQVSAVLRKTRCPSRRALLVSARAAY